MKAYTILLKMDISEGEEQSFVSRFREGAFDEYLDGEKVERLVKEFYQILYLDCYWVLFWCILKAVGPEVGYSHGSGMRIRFEMTEYCKKKF